MHWLRMLVHYLPWQLKWISVMSKNLSNERSSKRSMNTYSWHYVGMFLKGMFARIMRSLSHDFSTLLISKNKGSLLSVFLVVDGSFWWVWFKKWGISTSNLLTRKKPVGRTFSFILCMLKFYGGLRFSFTNWMIDNLWLWLWWFDEKIEYLDRLFMLCMSRLISRND